MGIAPIKVHYLFIYLFIYYYPQNAIRREFHFSGCTTAGSLALILRPADVRGVRPELLHPAHHCIRIRTCSTTSSAAARTTGVATRSAKRPSWRPAAGRSRVCVTQSSGPWPRSTCCSPRPEGVRFLGSLLASCEAEIVREELQGACPEREQCQCESSTSAGALRGSLLLMAAILLAFLFLK